MDLTVLVLPDIPKHRLEALSKEIIAVTANLGCRAEVVTILDFPGAEWPDPKALLQTKGEYVAVLHETPRAPDVLARLWEARRSAELIVASPSPAEGNGAWERIRLRSSALAARLIARLLMLEAESSSSPAQLYRRELVDDLAARGVSLAGLLEVLVHASVGGWSVDQVALGLPSSSQSRDGAAERSSSLRRVRELWVLRNSIQAADYDMRAFDSRIPLQRWWQRRRHEITYSMAAAHKDGKILNVGCGSSRILVDLPGSVGVDILHHKLRYMRRYRLNPLVTGSIFALPFPDAAFDCVICSEVIEHVPRDPSPLSELARVLAPGGRMVVSTPDYGTLLWPKIELAYKRLHPQGYADEHITHYTRDGLIDELQATGLRCVDLGYVFGAVLVAAFERS